MTKTTKILLVIVVIAAIACWLVVSTPWRTSEVASDKIAISDTAVITRIFLANKNGTRILLERKENNTWIVNGKETADETRIRLLLATLHDMRIRKTIPASMHNTAVAQLASTGIKTEAYDGDELVSTIYVGSETPERTGTFMMPAGSDEVYDVHVPGFVGYLTPRFILNEIKWYSKLVFNENAGTIKSVQVTYPATPVHSFSWTREKGYNQVTDSKGNAIKADTLFVKYYLTGYKDLYAEGYYEEQVFSPQERDSLIKRTPYCVVEVENINGEKKKLTVYHKPVGRNTRQQTNEQGEPLLEDPEKYFAIVDDKPFVASIQQYNFGRLFRKAGEFAQK